MERGVPQRHLHRHAAGPPTPSRRRNRGRRQQLSRPRKRTGIRRAKEKEMNPVEGSDAAFVATVLTLYADLPDTPLRPSPADQSLARKLFTEPVPLTLIESALLLGTLRRLSRAPGLPP